jgi:hypothetical protein
MTEALDIFAKFATDESLEDNGTWFPIGKSSKLLIARSGNRAYGRALTKAVETNRVALDVGDESADAVSERIMIDVLANTILLGWENISFKGEAMPYSVENAKKLLAVKDFRKQVVQFSENFESFKLKEEVQQGNG